MSINLRETVPCLNIPKPRTQTLVLSWGNFFYNQRGTRARAQAAAGAARTHARATRAYSTHAGWYGTNPPPVPARKPQVQARSPCRNAPARHRPGMVRGACRHGRPCALAGMGVRGACRHTGTDRTKQSQSQQGGCACAGMGRARAGVRWQGACAGTRGGAGCRDQDSLQYRSPCARDMAIWPALKIRVVLCACTYVHTFISHFMFFTRT